MMAYYGDSCGGGRDAFNRNRTGEMDDVRLFKQRKKWMDSLGVRFGGINIRLE